MAVDNFLGEVETSVAHEGIAKSEKVKFEARCLVVAKARLDLNIKQVIDTLEVFSGLPEELQTWDSFREVFRESFPSPSDGHIERLTAALAMRPTSFAEKDLSAFIMSLRCQLASWAKAIPASGPPSLKSGMTSADEALPTQVYLIKAILALAVPTDMRGAVLKRVTDSSMGSIGVDFAAAVKSKSSNGSHTIVQAAAYSQAKHGKGKDKSRVVPPSQQHDTNQQQRKQNSTNFSPQAQAQTRRPASSQQSRGGHHRGRGRGAHRGNYRENQGDYQGQSQGYSRGQSRGGRYNNNSHRGSRGTSQGYRNTSSQGYEFTSDQCQGCLGYQHMQVGCLATPRCPFHGHQVSGHTWNQCVTYPEKVEATRSYLNRQQWYFLAVGEQGADRA